MLLQQRPLFCYVFAICLMLLQQLAPCTSWTSPKILSIYPGLALPSPWSLIGGAGGLFRKYRRSPAALYRQLLEEQRDLLERQLRQTRDELANLRQQYQTLQTRKNSGKSASPIQAHQVRHYKQQIEDLEDEVRKLTELRRDLERMLQDEQLKALALEEKVQELHRVSAAMKQQYERELQQLRKDMEEQANRQLEALRSMMENRMKEALEKARVAAEKEREQARIDADLARETAVRETERRVQQQAEKELLAERKKAEEAVEREKVKMRKLIKALAEREKKLLSQAEQAKQKTTANVTTKTQVASNPSSQHTSPGTVRGPLK